MLEDADCVIHCSTVGRTSGETNGVNVLYPEIEGMMNLLDCCEKKNIMRFILVGCISNVMTGKYWNNFNESHWANPDICDIYERAKFFVEKCAWNYYEHNKKNFKLTVFLPGLLIGPLKKRGERSTNVIFFKKILKKKLDWIINIKIPVVDVMDVTSAILKSIKNVSTFNQRYILNEGVYWL